MDQAPVNLTDNQIEEYKALLSGMDWWYMMSDDNEVWRAGERNYRRAVELRGIIDQDHEIWNKYVPKEMHK